MDYDTKKATAYTLIYGTMHYHRQRLTPIGTSLVVQRLGLCASTLRDAGSVPSQGTEILSVVHRGQNTKKRKKLTTIEHLLSEKSESEVAQSCPTLCDPVDYSPPGSSIHGILQARILEWVAISFSRDLQNFTRKGFPGGRSSG